MKSSLTISVAAATMTLGLMAQKLETQKPDSKMVIRVETAKDHLTVIELSDAVTMVAVGNRSAFTVERRENKVFVTPTDEGARTNLFIWTSGGRYAYELVPAADIDQMHFAIDQVAVTLTSSVPAPATGSSVQTAERLPAEMLTAATPVLVTGERETSGRVEVTVRDLYRKNHRVYLRYAVANQTDTSYLPTRPAAWILEGARAQQSLISLGEHQLGEKLARTVKSDAETTLGVVDADQTALVAPGGHGWGWLVLEEKATSLDSVAVLRLQFAADAKGTVDAVLVLQPASAREVAHARPTVR
jgi:sulfur transfer complex TusBCD TusB component (DsrH family)